MENAVTTVFRDLMILLLALALMWGTAYGVSLIQSFFDEEVKATAYGLPTRYADDEILIQARLWVGKENKTPFEMPPGLSPTGDTIGNSGSYDLRLIREQVEQPSISWNRWVPELNNVTYYREPVLTVTNPTGGIIRAVYNGGTSYYSVDKTRVPDPDPVHRLDVDVWENTGGHMELPEYMVIRINNPAYTSIGTQQFGNLYPEYINEMGGVYRNVGVSHLYVFSMDPTEVNKVLAEADIRFVHYSVWLQEDGSPLSDEQLFYLKALNLPNAAYCTAELSEYTPHLIIE